MLFYVFFFFKQKTAYEMRISDWSSDVCSSDLPVGASLLAMRPSRATKILLGKQPHPFFQPSQGQREHPVLHQFAHDIGRGGVAPGVLREIGRASCRERVCQYV